jgi:hypothetical protein
MKRRGGLSSKVDPAVEEWQKKAAQNKAAMSARERAEIERTRLNMDVPTVVKQTLRTLADQEHEDTSMSQLGSLLLAYGLKVFLEDDDLQEQVRAMREFSRTPRFAYNLAEPAAWIEAFRAFLFNGEV